MLVKTEKFTFEGKPGIVQVFDNCPAFVQWATLSCSVTSLRGKLRDLVDGLVGGVK